MQCKSLSLAIALGLPVLGASSLSPAYAQDAATDLDDIVVTATRTAVSVDASLAAVEVIDRSAIERSQARSLPELLRGRAGINLVNQGGAGKLTTLFLRGTESDHTLFLVDGVRIGSTTSGLASLQDIPVEQIDRIEIVRGPRSSLYGADAIGGVIQIFTRRAGNGIAPRFRVGAGSHGLREASAGLDIGRTRAWFGADVAWQRTDGINACDVATPTPFSGGCFIFAPQPDRDGYRNRSLSLRGGFDPTDALGFEARALRAEGHNDYDGDFVDNSDIVQQAIGGKARWRPTDAVDLQLNVGRNLDVSDSYLQDSFNNRFETTRDSATLQGDFALAEGRLLTLGLDWLRDRADVDSGFSPFSAERDNRAAFAQLQWRAGAHDVQAGLRHDDNQQFGGHGTGNLAWGWSFADGLRLTASVGTAFKAPTFNELYYPFFGNPDLRPEESTSVEVGLGQRRDRWHWQLNAYDTRIDDLIAYDASLGLPNNIDRARIRGAEFVVGTALAGWDVAAQASVVDPRSASGFQDGNILPRRARAAARFDLDRSIGSWRFGATWIGEGNRYDNISNTRRLGGYATLDLRAEYVLAPAWTLQANVSNALDRDYETASFYNQPGREFGIGLRWRPAR